MAVWFELEGQGFLSWGGQCLPFLASNVNEGTPESPNGTTRWIESFIDERSARAIAQEAKGSKVEENLVDFMAVIRAGGFGLIQDVQIDWELNVLALGR